MSERTFVLVYEDYIENNGLAFRALCAHFGHEHVRYCDADDILEGCLDKTARLFVMPGGADLYFCEKLNGAGNAAIRAFVESGGNFLGICGGAYYACRTLEWMKDDPENEITGPRELAFLDATAKGPLPGYCGKLTNGIPDPCAVPLTDKDGQEYALCYRGGPAILPDEDEQCEVLATYNTEGKPPAIVKKQIGQGTAILSGPHPEQSAADLLKKAYAHNRTLGRHETVSHDLEPFEQQRSALWTSILNTL